MARTPNKVEVQVHSKYGSAVYEMTPRQAALFMYLSDRMGAEVPISEIMEHLRISVQNLRTTKMQVARIISSDFTIVSRWGKSYSMQSNNAA